MRIFQIQLCFCVEIWLPPPQMAPKRKILEEPYEIQKLLARRVKRGQIEYLVAWKGFGADGDTWEPPEHIPAPFLNKFLRFREELPASPSSSA